MAFNGSLLSVGEYRIPTDRFINAGSYNVTRNVQDLDSYRDANGLLHREALEHTVHKVEFDTPPMLSNTDVAELFSAIARNYTDAKERKALVTAYDPETDSYITQYMYLANPKFTMHCILDGLIRYEPVHISFTGY